MRHKIYAVKEMEFDGKITSSVIEYDGTHSITDWSYVRITTIDGSEINVKKDDTNTPNIELISGYVILTYD